MSNYIVDGSDLTDIAEAIRAKGGTSGQLQFPQGFVDAIGQISGGWVKSLTAVFAQADSRVFTTDDLDDLRDRLTVTATYEDNTSAVVTDYDLSGTLRAGTSTILVNYGDKTTSFDAVVTEAVDVTPALSSWAGMSNVNVNVNTEDGSILVYTTSAGTYKYATANVMSVLEGYNYRISADVDYFAGDVYLALTKSASTSVMLRNGTVIHESGKFYADGVPSDNENFETSGRVRLFVAWGTSKAGRAVFRNLKVIRYSTATAADALNILMGGESA